MLDRTLPDLAATHCQEDRTDSVIKYLKNGDLFPDVREVGPESKPGGELGPFPPDDLFYAEAGY